ncbi:MAG TPA: tetratricopeptide repeat protein [Ktedonobacteraceae bacterium]|jgi:predicted ATPase/DNA-binding XRE family transcriptional regulator|nr:tetratricopeptide repeat protein [Ktedonobacteraceae bacterium]
MSTKREHNTKLQQERIARGWNQEELAAQLGVDARTVRRWEGGQPVRPYNIAGLTKLFGKSAKELGLIEEGPGEDADLATVAARISSPDRPVLSSNLLAGFRSLPIPPTPMIGRAQELDSIKQLLRREEVRLLTLAGPGGVGKTRLAVQVAAELQEMFAEGVFFVDLAPVRDPFLVARMIADALGVQEAGGQPLLENLKAYLQGRRSLLLLDNFEQVIDAAPLLAELLATCWGIKLLVTSREVLRLRGEHEFIVPPLALPEPPSAKAPPDPVALQNSAAVALFVQRTQAIKPDFKLTATNSAAIAEICIRLDGLPLAIELAAAKSKVLPPQALLSDLGNRMHLGVLRDLPSRQQTIHDSIAWSYDLLTIREQRLFRRLCVFVSGCTLHAAEAVCIAPEDQSYSLMDEVISLIDKSLLLPLKYVEGEEPRITMLEMIHEYGLKCLEESGEAEITRDAHALYYLALAEQAELLGSQAQSWLRRLEVEHQNLRTALHRVFLRGSSETAWRLCASLWPFWRAHGHLSEGRSWLDQALEQDADIAPAIRAKVLSGAGILAGLQGSYEQAQERCQESLALFRQLGDQQGSATSLNFLAQIATWKSAYAQAHKLGEEALALFRELNDAPGIIDTLVTLATASFNEGNYASAGALAGECLQLSRAQGNTSGMARSLWLQGVGSFMQGDHAKADALLTESLALSKEVGDKRGIADALVILAYTAFYQGGPDRMRELLDEALELHRAVGDRRGIALGLYGQGWLAIGQGDYVTAHHRHRESLAILLELGHQWFSILCIEGLAFSASQQAHFVLAARLWGIASALREAIGAPIPPLLELMYERVITNVRSQLGQEAYTLAWTEGRKMQPDEIYKLL